MAKVPNLERLGAGQGCAVVQPCSAQPPPSMGVWGWAGHKDRRKENRACEVGQLGLVCCLIAYLNARMGLAALAGHPAGQTAKREH
jgi:hypothetical protein